MEKIIWYIETFKNYLNYLWNIWWFKLILIYFLYLIVVFIWWKVGRGFVKNFIKKTKTNLDDKIVKVTKRYIIVLILLLGLNFTFKFITTNSVVFLLFIQIIKTIEVFLVIVILTKSIVVIKRHLGYKRKSEPEKLNLLNLFYIGLLVVVYVVGWLYLLKIWGINITPLLASAGIFGLAVAMAAQDVIKNFLAWIIIFFDQPIKVGHKIKLSDGRIVFVEEIGFRSTKFKTLDGNILVVPNADIINQTIENYNDTLSEMKKVKVVVGLPYWVDTEKAKKIIIEIFKEDKRILPDTIVARVDSLADWSVNIGCVWQVPAEKYDWLIEKELLEKIYKRLPEAWIDFPFPTYEVYLKK